MKSLRFAAATYSNSAPLVACLKDVNPSIKLYHGVPSMHVEELIAGKIDCALIPVAHAFKHPELTTLDHVGVASDGPVKSVLLKCHKPINQIISVARDPASGTSNVLAELLLHHHFGLSVEMVDDNVTDAEVVIGDRALLSEPAEFGDIDLASAWKELTNLPFVFAVWALRPNFEEVDIVEEITMEAAHLGCNRIPKLADHYSQNLGNSADYWRSYLENSIRYFITDKDLEGIKKFKTMATVHQLLLTQVEA